MTRIETSEDMAVQVGQIVQSQTAAQGLDMLVQARSGHAFYDDQGNLISEHVGDLLTQAEYAPDTTPDETYAPYYSTQPDMSDLQPLDGATVPGEIYVVAVGMSTGEPVLDLSGVTSVRFMLDGVNTHPSGADTTSPYQAKGGSSTSAVPLSVSGSATLTMEVDEGSGYDAPVTASFTAPAVGAPQIASASASDQYTSSEGPEKAIDGLTSTRWASNAGRRLDLTLTAAATVGEVAVAWYLGDQRQAFFDLYTSTDGTTWTKVYAGISSGATTAPEIYRFPERTATHVRIVGAGNTVNDFTTITEVTVATGDEQAVAAPGKPTISTSPKDQSAGVTYAGSYGPVPDSFTLQRAAAEAGPWTTVQSGLTTGSFTDTGLTNGTTYWHRVLAVNVDQPQGVPSDAVSVVPSEAPTVVSIMHTTADQSVWESRAAANHQGWSYIKADADSFAGSSSVRASTLWTPQHAAPYTEGDHDDCAPVGGGHTSYTPIMLRAALAAKVTGNQTRARQVIDNLIAQANVANADMSGAAGSTSYSPATHPTFTIGNHVGLCVQALDYVAEWATEAEIVTVLDWARDLNPWIAQHVYDDVSGFLTGRGDAAVINASGSASDNIRIHTQGVDTSSAAGRYSNRHFEVLRGSAAVSVARIRHRAAGVTFAKGSQAEDEQYLQQAIDFAIETIKFTFVPDGSFAEFERWADGATDGSRGWQYVVGTIGSMIDIAHMANLAGDDTLYEFSTVDGITATATKTSGAPSGWSGKSLEWAADSIVRLTDRTATGRALYASSGTSYPITDKYGSNEYNRQVYMALGNLRWADSYIGAAVRRVSPFPAAYSPSSDGQYADNKGASHWHPSMAFQWVGR